MIRVTLAVLGRPGRGVVVPTSPYTGAPYGHKARAVLNRVAAARGFTSKYWLTYAQAARNFGTRMKSGEQPTAISHDVTGCYNIEDIVTKDARKFLDEHPPQFGMRMCLFSRTKWFPLRNAKLQAALNPSGKTSQLFVDEELVRERGMALHAGAEPVNIAQHTTFNVYNAQQMVDPGCVRLQEGVALNSYNGRRFGYPAHSALIATMVARGYRSPFWVDARALRAKGHGSLSLRVRRGFENHFVTVPLMSGTLTPYRGLPDSIKKKLRSSGPSSDERQKGVHLYVFGARGWQGVRETIGGLSGAVRRSSCPNETLWVDLDELEHVIPQEELIAALLAVKKRPLLLPLVELCTTTVINAECTSDPQRCVPATKTVELLGERPVGARLAEQLRQFRTQHRFISPLWVTIPGARRLGVAPLRLATPIVIADDVRTQQYYNIDQFAEPAKILALMPPRDTGAHQGLLVRWMPFTSKYIQRRLGDSGYTRKLWISVSDTVMLGLKLLDGAEPINIRNLTKTSQAFTGRIYNAEQTTDPVRVAALMRLGGRV